jgi:phosphotransacetylase
MTLEEAQAKIQNEVYAATLILEKLEVAGLVTGNGHHMRQKVAAFASEMVKERWTGPRENS